MKLSLVVLTPGKQEGRHLPITLSQFLIGRDPQCHLRPASAAISKRHCAILVKNGKVFVRDFDSTNGTFVNEEPIKGEVEVRHDDKLRVGPLVFGLNIELSAKTPAQAPAAKTAAAAPAQSQAQPSANHAATATEDLDESEESIAAMLLSLQDDSAGSSLGSGEIPEGSTVMEMVVPPMDGETPSDDNPDQNAAKPAGKETTSSAAKSILEKYMRRPRG